MYLRGQKMYLVNNVLENQIRAVPLLFDYILFHFQVSAVHVQMLLMVPGEVYEIYQQKCLHSLCNEGDLIPII